MKNNITIKRKIAWDNDGVAAATIGLIVLLLSGAGLFALGITALTSDEPDITYNITDTGFALAGIEFDSLTLMLIAGLAITLIAVFLFARKK